MVNWGHKHADNGSLIVCAQIEAGKSPVEQDLGQWYTVIFDVKLNSRKN